jgi:hypothetical protein
VTWWIKSNTSYPKIVMARRRAGHADETVLFAKQVWAGHREIDHASHSMANAGREKLRTGQDRDANWLLVLPRLKMRKLQLKDQIARIEDALLPDILRRREPSP